MTERIINQFGEKSIYIEKNDGTVYVGEYVTDPNTAFADESYELEAYEPFIQPPIVRREVDEIYDWILRDTPEGKPDRVALLYGNAGIGKSVVMHDLFLKVRANQDYLVLGLKSDQIEFLDTDDLAKQMHLAKPLAKVVEEKTKEIKRVVILIDQIDALSLSLSSNRTPLRSLLKLIGQIRNIKGVRIVISCRPYDMEYDPDLDHLRITNKWELQKISNDEVKKVLKNNDLEPELGSKMLNFLGNPLHLVLYLKVIKHVELRSPLTQELLYDELWKVFVVNANGDAFRKELLLSLLDALIDTMYKRQELSVHLRDFETNYNNELAYLLHHGILTKTKNNHIQFFHQTMFDYVYARRFVESGKDLLGELANQHQGLFSRAAVKSILSFQRAIDPKLYKRNVNQLLFAKKEDGSEKYRFHLKSLALSNMTYFDSPKKEEIDLISQKIYSDEAYFGVILESVHTGDWFNATWKIIDSKGGWPSLSPNYKDKVMVMCRRTLWADADAVLDISNKIIDYGHDEDRSYVNNLLSYQNFDCEVDKIIALYKKLSSNCMPLECTSLLKNILKDAPDFVCSEIKKNIASQLAAKDRPSFKVVSFNHDEEDVFNTLENIHHDHAIKLYADLLGMIMEATKFDVPEAEISNSFEFSHFQLSSGRHFTSDFTEDIANKLIEDFKTNIDNPLVKAYLDQFINSNYDGYVFIALYIYTTFASRFVNDIYSVITSRKILFDAPCWVEYQGLEALKASFIYMNDEQKKRIIDYALKVKDCGEYKLFDKNRMSLRLQYGMPLLDIDVHRGKILYSIDYDILKKYNWYAYQERLRIERKYKRKADNGKITYPRLENERPFKMSSMSGLSSVGEDHGSKMSCDTWYKSMIKYVVNNHVDWNRPSLTGQCQLFRSIVAGNPDKFISFINEITRDEKILLVYVESGMRGLLDAGRMSDAEHVFTLILEQIGNDVNTEYRGFEIHAFLFAMDDFIKANYVPQTVFDFICNAVLNVYEPEEDNQSNSGRDVYNTGINQSRGHAAHLLVQCYCYEEFKEQLFETLEQIADKASVYTRSAALLNMAVLNCLDKERNLALFLKMMHDYEPRLMAMPVHNHNPLVYFINFAFDKLIDYFRHASDTPLCYKEVVILLWIAWSHNNHHKVAQELLNKICDESEEARIALIGFLRTLDEQMSSDAEEYILRFMTEQYDSKELGAQYDSIFHHMDEWKDDIRDKIAKSFINSPFNKYAGRSFMNYLAKYAITEPLTSLQWLEIILSKKKPDDYNMWNQVTDVLIQSYNGIKSFDCEEYQGVLERAMDMMDQLMQNKDNKYLITNFISKLDNE